MPLGNPTKHGPGFQDVAGKPPVWSMQPLFVPDYTCDAGTLSCPLGYTGQAGQV